MALVTHGSEGRRGSIHDHALIGDGRSAALVARSGAIDWLCWPRFDSPPIFASLVSGGGGWWIAPASPARVVRRYLEGTNIVETRFEGDRGACVLTDLMTVASQEDKRRQMLPDHEILRRVTCARGEVALEVRVEPRPDFGRKKCRASQHERLGIRWEIGKHLLTLRADVPLALTADGVACGVIRLRAGESAVLSLAFDEDGPAVLPPLGHAADERIARTAAWWRRWIARARYHGPHRDAVLRSALAVKLLAFAPSGAIVAAPTTSLPERIGGDMNWDYRFCWLRDASFTARALLRLGYVEDAEAFCSWTLHATRLTRPELRVLYDVYGRRPGPERDVPGVPGHRGSAPVRVGNATRDQLQLDTYGEVIDATAQLARVTGSLDGETRRLLRDFSQLVARRWHRPDQGIWEPRGEARHRTHSRLLCWVALDRVLALADAGLVDRVDRDALAAQRAAIRQDIEENAYDRRRGCYTAAFGDPELDASVLLMSYHGFHPACSDRMRSTWAGIDERLGAGPGLLYRYEDSLRSREGAFWICSFWAIEHLARGGGTLDEARDLMEAATSYASDLGLMAEEIDPATGEALGNFPQAYTHVGLIDAAFSIEDRARAQDRQGSGRERSRPAAPLREVHP